MTAMHHSRNDKCRVPQAFWRAAGRAGMTPAAILRQARLPATLHLADDAWITTAQYFALWRAVEHLSGDPAIGIRMTVDTDIAGHPPATMAAFFACDYRDALTRLARYKRLCTPEALTMVETGGECRIAVNWIFGSGGEPDASADVTFAAVVELGRRGSGRDIVPLRVEMTRAGPASPAHTDYLRAPIRYGAAHNAIVLDRADLDRPFATHNPELLAIMAPALTASLEEIAATSSLTDQVRIVLKRRLASGRPDIGEVARELGTSERTLQRRIADAGGSFRGLLDEARHDLSRQMLADPRNGVDEIAFLLGYQDTGSFYRAFRGWEGKTPARWREAMH